MNSTHKFRILEALKRGEFLTAHDAFKNHGVATFSQRICDIEKMGYNVARAWVTSDSGKKHMIYWLVKEKVAA